MTTAHRPTKSALVIGSVLSLMTLASSAGVIQTVWAQSARSEEVRQDKDEPVTNVTQTQVAPAATAVPTSSTRALQFGTEDAPEQIMLSAIPPRLGDDQNLKAKPGGVIQTTIRVRNGSSQVMPISTLVQDFIIGEDGETPVPITEETNNRWSLASWVELSPTNQVLQPRQTANVSVLIRVPEDALPGGHYAMILHEPGTAPIGPEGAQSRVAQRVGTLVYFLVEGPINEEAFVRNFDFQNLTEYGPVPYQFTIENMSDIHIKPQVKIEIHNFFGKKVDEIVPEAKNVFPLMSRKYDGNWDRVWGIGPYTAKMTLSFGSKGQIVMAQDSFWLIPYKIVAAALLGLLTLIGIGVAIRRHLIHRNTNEQARIQELEQRLQELEVEKLKKFDE